MPLVGNARTSTFDQIAGFDAQRRYLEAAGCRKIFAEQVSSVAAREQLRAALDYLRVGDVPSVLGKPRCMDAFMIVLQDMFGRRLEYTD